MCVCVSIVYLGSCVVSVFKHHSQTCGAKGQNLACGFKLRGVLLTTCVWFGHNHNQEVVLAAKQLPVSVAVIKLYPLWSVVSNYLGKHY